MAVAVVRPWVAMAGPTDVAMDIAAARLMAATVALAVEAPVHWKAVALAVETRGFPW